MNNEYSELEAKLNQAEEYINNQYLCELNNYEVLDVEKVECQNRYLRLYYISKIVYDQDEDSFKKLRTVINSIGFFSNSVALIIKGNHSHVDLYLAINSKNYIKLANELLRDSFTANFPGSNIELKKIENNNEGLNLSKECVSITSFIPSNPPKKESGDFNGLEKFVETMKGQEYIGIILSKPLKENEIKNRINGLETIYSALSPLEKTTFSNGSNEGYTLSKGISDTISQSISNGMSLANSVNQSANKSKSTGTSFGLHTFLNVGINNSSTQGTSNGTTTSDTSTRTDTTSSGRTTTSSHAKTTSTSRNTTNEYKNKNVIDMLSKIEKHIERLKEGSALGMWECCVYFVGDTNKTVSMAASSFSSMLIDKESHIGNLNVNIFGINNTNTKKIIKYLNFLNHPKFRVKQNQKDYYDFIPTIEVNGDELSLLNNLPKRSLNGIEIETLAEFGRNIEIRNERSIKLGNIYHMREVQENNLILDLDSLTSHCFITGSTGSGKSNTVYKLLENICLSENNIPFLIVEPAKGEYRDEFRKIKNINLFTTNPSLDQMLTLNPFSFDKKIHILEHLDRLIEIFNGCWEMYAAMPAILKDAIEKAYVVKGWDLMNSIFLGESNDKFPTFLDVLRELPKVIKTSGYSGETQSDYTGALVTRVNSMTNGIYGQIFCSNFEVDDNTLFNTNTIIDLSRVGSSETKSLIMGILVLKLTEFRMSNAERGNSKLKHITILEEAHNLLKNTKNIYSTGNNSIISKSVEMIVNSIAEMRTYGEGFVIVDQSPTSVDIAAIKNTNTKIIMRLPDKDDCDIAGHSTGLNENQIKELPRLETGVAVVMQNNWHDAVLSKIERANGNYYETSTEVDYENLKCFRSLIIKELIDEYITSDNKNVEKIYKSIDSFEINSAKKKEMRRIVSQFDSVVRKKFDTNYVGKTILRLSKSEDVFSRAEELLKYDNTKDVNEFTEESLREWYHFIDNSLINYLDLNIEYLRRVKQYIVNYKISENRLISYNKLYYQVYIK